MNITYAPTVTPCLEPHWFLCMEAGTQFFIVTMSGTFIFTTLYLIATRNRGKKVEDDESRMYEYE
jgi:hypothetical protein